MTLPNPWTIIGWLLLFVIIVVLIAGLSTALELREANARKVVRTADVPPAARDATPRGAPETAPAPS